jgi:membrane-associated protease RseP (regulator of RpoE activity)
VSGLQVIAVTPGSPAAEAGIEPGDILMRIDSRNLKVPDDLTTAELFMQSGRPVEVVLDRGGRTIMTFQMEPAPTPGTSAPLLLTGVPPATSAATDSSAGTGAGAGAPAGGGRPDQCGRSRRRGDGWRARSRAPRLAQRARARHRVPMPQRTAARREALAA